MSWPEIHGAATHFPVGLLTAAAIFEVAGRLFRKAEWRTTALWALALGSLMTLPSAVAGLMTARTLYPHEAWPLILREHIACALSAAVLGGLALWARARAGDAPKWLPFALLLGAAAGVGAAGYLGGKMALA